MDEPQNKRKKSNYFMQRKRKQFVLEPGLKGFLCSCNFREKECVRESYNILNMYADKLDHNAEPSNTEIKEIATPEDNSDSDDIGDELQKEIDAVKNSKTSQRRFQVVESGAKNFVFIRTTVDNPVEIVSAVINDILVSKQQKTRYLLRLVPIEITCKANMADIKSSATSLIGKHFSGDSKTFSVIFNHRNNNQINRDDIIKEIASIIAAKDSKHTVNLKEPDLAFIVEIIRGICLMSVVPNYHKFKKYNLLQLWESVNGAEENVTKDEVTDTNV